jgi:hypothetical protein
VLCNENRYLGGSITSEGSPTSYATITPRSSRGSVDSQGQRSHRGLLQDLPVCASYTKVGPPLPNREWGSDHIPIRMCFNYQFPMPDLLNQSPSSSNTEQPPPSPTTIMLIVNTVAGPLQFDTMPTENIWNVKQRLWRHNQNLFGSPGQQVLLLDTRVLDDTSSLLVQSSSSCGFGFFLVFMHSKMK